MRVNIALTATQRHKLRLLVGDTTGNLSAGTLVAYLLNVHLAQHKIRVCGAHRCDTEFIYRLRSPGRPKIYCCNACRVAQQYHVKKGGDPRNG